MSSAEDRWDGNSLVSELTAPTLPTLGERAHAIAQGVLQAPSYIVNRALPGAHLRVLRSYRRRNGITDDNPYDGVLLGALELINIAAAASMQQSDFSFMEHPLAHIAVYAIANFSLSSLLDLKVRFESEPKQELRAMQELVRSIQEEKGVSYE